VGLYWYTSLDSAQVEAFKSGPFNEFAATNWCFATHQRPQAAAGLKASSSSPSEITLSWDISNDPLTTGYYVYRDGARIGETREHSFRVTGLDPSQISAYVIKPHNSEGDESEIGAAATVRTLDAFSRSQVKPAVYPSPFLSGRDRQITFYNLHGTSSVRVFTPAGAEVFAAVTDKTSLDIHPDLWSAGMYLYVVRGESGTHKGKLAVIK